MKDLLQLGAFEQPPQKLLDLSPFQPLIVGVITLLESRGSREKADIFNSIVGGRKWDTERLNVSLESGSKRLL